MHKDLGWMSLAYLDSSGTNTTRKPMLNSQSVEWSRDLDRHSPGSEKIVPATSNTSNAFLGPLWINLRGDVVVSVTVLVAAPF